MSSNIEDIIYENLQEISGSTSKYNANSAGIKKKNIVVKGRNNVSDTKTENVNVAANEDAIYGNSGNVVITSSKINIKCAKSNTVDIISVKKDTDDNEGEIYENLGFLQKPNERETHKDVTNGKITVYNNTNTENERSKDNIKKDLSKCLNEALAKRSHIVQHNITRYNEDDDQAIYDNTNFQESIPKVDNQLSLSNNVVVLEDDCAIYENTSLSEKVKDRKRENNLGAHHQGSTQRNGEFSEKWNGYDQVEGSNYSDNGSDDYGEMMMKFRSPEDGHYFPDRSNEDFYDDFDSDSWDSEPEEINYIESFSANVTSNALPLKEILENKLFQNMDWSDIMTKLQFRFDDREKHLQNGKYQLVVAEWSFLKSMNILQDQFVDKLFILLSNNEKSKLFAYVKEVRDSSHNFMQDLEKCWVKNAFTDNFCEIIYNNLIASFEVYLQYTANQVYSEALLGEIISDKSRDFKDLLVEIQAEPKCNGLHLHAYQLTPIRKINSLPSLLQNIFKCLSPRDREYGFCKKSLDFLNELLSRCNTESKKSKDNLRTKTILEKLEFPRNTPFKMNNSGDIHMRTFIKSDKMELIEMNSTLFRKKINRKPVYIFLFNDIFVVARYRSSTGKYQVLDYTFRINIELDPEPELLHITYGIDISTILYLHIKENCDLKKIDMILSCETRTDVIRWNEALDPPDSGKINNYFDFNILKNVMVVCNYSAVHSDEISLTNGERFKILRETEDGWSFGQREKDGECGWFQTEYVVLLDNIQKKDNRSRHRLNK